MTIIEQSERTRNVTAQLAILAAALFVVGTNAFVIAGVLPEIASTFHVGVAAVGYSITWYAIVVAVASPVVSIVFARMPRTRLMAGGLALIAVGTAIAAAAHGLPLFTTGRVLAALGGAALVPAATAAGPALVTAAQRGRALAITGLGFTLATAIGAPLGTELAELGGWRLSLGVLAGIAAALTAAIHLWVRGVPTGPALSFGARFSILHERPVVFALLATLLMTTAFNLVYVFSSDVVHDATRGDGTLLAVLLLVFGGAGVVGNWLGGRLSDRLGSKATTMLALSTEALMFCLLVPLRGSLLATAAAFAVWGLATFAAIVPVQHRLVAIDPQRAGLSLSWYSTAMYLGIALAPVLGAAAVDHGASALLVTAAVVAIAAVLVFGLGYLSPRRALSPRGTAASTTASS